MRTALHQLLAATDPAPARIDTAALAVCFGASAVRHELLIAGLIRAEETLGDFAVAEMSCSPRYVTPQPSVVTAEGFLTAAYARSS